MKKIFTVALSALVLATGCKKDDATTPAPMQVSGTMTAANEVPASSNPSPATGNVTGTYNPTSKVLSYTIAFANLTSAATTAHFHYGDAKHANPTPIIPLTPPSATSGTISGTTTLTAPQADSLKAGHMYANIHTANYKAGEIRANVVVK
jgi:hypothetical protein